MSNLMLYSGATPTIRVAPEALEQRAKLLNGAKLVLTVVDAGEQQTAVLLCRDMKFMLKQVEDTRKSVKKPVLDLGKTIDRLADDVAKELQAEYDRVTKLIAGFQAEEAERVRLQEEARRREIAELQAKEDAARDALQKAEASLAAPTAGTAELDRAVAAEAAAQQTAAAATTAIYAPLPSAQREAGMAVKRVPTVVVKDLGALFKHNPALVRMELNRSALNDLLYEGAEFPGLEITWGVAVSVRS